MPIHEPQIQRLQKTRGGSFRPQSNKPGNSSLKRQCESSANMGPNQRARLAQTDANNDQNNLEALDEVTETKPNFNIAYSSVTLPIPNRHDFVVADSGATSHIVIDRSKFLAYQAITPVKIFTARRNEYLHAIGMGFVPLIFKYNGIETQVTLLNVLHSPDAANNLIST